MRQLAIPETPLATEEWGVTGGGWWTVVAPPPQPSLINVKNLKLISDSRLAKLNDEQCRIVIAATIKFSFANAEFAFS